MSKKFIFAVLVGLTVTASSASASHCTCWKAIAGVRTCLGRIHSFNGYPHQCVDACADYERGLQPAGMIDNISLRECGNQTRRVYGGWDNKKGKTPGEPWS